MSGLGEELLGASYAGVRITRFFRTRIELVDWRIKRIVPSIDLSAGIRILYQRIWASQCVTQLPKGT